MSARGWLAKRIGVDATFLSCDSARDIKRLADGHLFGHQGVVEIEKDRGDCWHDVFARLVTIQRVANIQAAWQVVRAQGAAMGVDNEVVATLFVPQGVTHRANFAGASFNMEGEQVRVLAPCKIRSNGPQLICSTLAVLAETPMAHRIIPSSFKCDCGRQSDFGERTIREMEEDSRRRHKRMQIGDSAGEEHTIEFDNGVATVVICPELGRCAITGCA